MSTLSKQRRVAVSLLVGLLFLGLSAYCEVARGQVPDAPESLVLRFDTSAASLDHAAIYLAVAAELHLIVADDGSELAATLIVSMTASGDIELTYRPARNVVTRTVGITNTSDVPHRIAHLVGNMVRDEAGTLLAELQAPAPPAPPPPVARPTTLDPWRQGGSGATTVALANVDVEPYLANLAISTLYVGGAVTPAATVQFAFHQSKRFDRLEVGLGVQLAYGHARPTSGIRKVHQITFPVSAEYRVLGGVESYLQLGTSFGLRLVEWESPLFALDLHATAGFRVGSNQGIVLRAGLGLLPLEFEVSRYTNAPTLFPSMQLGWQIGW